MQLFRKSNKLQIMCHSPSIMKFSSHQNISPRSRSNEMESVTCQMATGHFPNCSHNFAWRGVINHDRMITLTLQTKYDTILPSGYPKSAYPLEISFWIRSLFTHGQTLPSHFAIGCETIGCRFDVVTSSQGHVNYVFTIMMLPHWPNSEIFIAPEQYIFHSDGEPR